jgi:hypothetical protein
MQCDFEKSAPPTTGASRWSFLPIPTINAAVNENLPFFETVVRVLRTGDRRLVKQKSLQEEDWRDLAPLTL